MLRVLAGEVLLGVVRLQVDLTYQPAHPPGVYQLLFPPQLALHLARVERRTRQVGFAD